MKLDSLRRYLSLDKKSIFYLAILVLVFFLVLSLIWYSSSKFSKIKTEPVIEKPTKEEVIKKQLEELEKLKKETPPLTEEEIKTQLQELEKFRKETKSLSEEEIKKQLEELNKLRSK